MPIIEVSELHKRYGETVAIDKVSFTVTEGEIFGILGPNGAGKTTTVECVQGLRTPVWHGGSALRVAALRPAGVFTVHGVGFASGRPVASAPSSRRRGARRSFPRPSAPSPRRVTPTRRWHVSRSRPVSARASPLSLLRQGRADGEGRRARLLFRRAFRPVPPRGGARRACGAAAPHPGRLHARAPRPTAGAGGHLQRHAVPCGRLRPRTGPSERTYEGIEECLRAGRERGVFRGFDVRVMAVSLQASIDGMFEYWVAYPDHSLKGHAAELVELFDRVTHAAPANLPG